MLKTLALILRTHFCGVHHSEIYVIAILRQEDSSNHKHESSCGVTTKI